MDFRKIFFVALTFLFVNQGFGQESESTEEDTIILQALVHSDTARFENHIISGLSLSSIEYEISDTTFVSGDLKIDFVIKDFSSFNIVQISLYSVNLSIDAPLKLITKTLSELIEEQSVIGDQVSLTIENCDLSLPYEMTILVTSPIGQEFRVLTITYFP